MYICFLLSELSGDGNAQVRTPGSVEQVLKRHG